MKKFFIPFLTLGLAVLVSSCSDSDEPAVSGGNAPANTVAITCQVPSNSIHSRGADANGFYGDGSEVNSLVYAVFDENGQKVLASDDNGAPVATFTNGKFTVYFPTEYSEKSYSIFLWADAWGHDAGTPFSYDWTAKTVRVDYTKSLKMGEKADAFYIYSTLNKNTFTLTRPFEQICVATYTEDYLKHPVSVSQIRFMIPDEDEAAAVLGDFYEGFFPVGFNFETGDIIAEDNIDYVDALFPDNSVKLNVDGREYTYLFMGYFFAPKPQSDYEQFFETQRNMNFVFSEVNTGSWNREIHIITHSCQNTRTLILPKKNSVGLLESSGKIEAIVSPNMNSTTEYDTYM